MRRALEIIGDLIGVAAIFFLLGVAAIFFLLWVGLSAAHIFGG